MSGATRDLLIQAAGAMLTDGADEAAGISMQATDANEAIGQGELLQALGILDDYETHFSALRSAVCSARTLLLRARDKGGA